MGKQGSKLLCGCGRKNTRPKTIIYHPSDEPELDIQQKAALLKDQDDDVTVSKIELHTTTDSDKDRISIQLAEKTSKSVGLIMGYLTYGTGFRVGEKYVMTSLHFVKDICSFGGIFKESNLESPDVYICFGYTYKFKEDSRIFHFRGQMQYANEELDVAILELTERDNKSLPPKILCSIDSNYDCLFNVLGQSYSIPNQITAYNIKILQKDMNVINKARAWSLDMFYENGYIGLDDPNVELCYCKYQFGMDGSPGIVPILQEKGLSSEESKRQINLQIAQNECSQEIRRDHESQRHKVSTSFKETIYVKQDDPSDSVLTNNTQNMQSNESDSDNEITYVKMVAPRNNAAVSKSNFDRLSMNINHTEKCRSDDDRRGCSVNKSVTYQNMPLRDDSNKHTSKDISTDSNQLEEVSVDTSPNLDGFNLCLTQQENVTDDRKDEDQVSEINLLAEELNENKEYLSDLSVDDTHHTDYGLNDTHHTDYGLNDTHHTDYGLNDAHHTDYGLHDTHHTDYGWNDTHHTDYGLNDTHHTDYGLNDTHHTDYELNDANECPSNEQSVQKNIRPDINDNNNKLADTESFTTNNDNSATKSACYNLTPSDCSRKDFNDDARCSGNEMCPEKDSLETMVRDEKTIDVSVEMDRKMQNDRLQESSSIQQIVDENTFKLDGTNHQESHVDNDYESSELDDNQIILTETKQTYELEEISLNRHCTSLDEETSDSEKSISNTAVYEPVVVFMVLRGYPTFYYKDKRSVEMEELVTSDKLVNAGVTMKSVYDHMKQYHIYRELCADIFVSKKLRIGLENSRVVYN
ncbi:putative uncharacterized protein DDB_G0282133 [Mytilus trossulus]|uniref:putative uncharacterized protein DDB_G0282133 n=1 Tax=Mytilus trossulus TaxID=6551 RepID=UPI0030042266